MHFVAEGVDFGLGFDNFGVFGAEDGAFASEVDLGFSELVTEGFGGFGFEGEAVSEFCGGGESVFEVGDGGARAGGFGFFGAEEGFELVGEVAVDEGAFSEVSEAVFGGFEGFVTFVERLFYPVEGLEPWCASEFVVEGAEGVDSPLGDGPGEFGVGVLDVDFDNVGSGVGLDIPGGFELSFGEGEVFEDGVVCAVALHDGGEHVEGGASSGESSEESGAVGLEYGEDDAGAGFVDGFLDDGVADAEGSADEGEGSDEEPVFAESGGDFAEIELDDGLRGGAGDGGLGLFA